MTETPGSRLPIWLVVSLIVNALLIGLIIGGGLGKRNSGPSSALGGGEAELARSMNSVLSGEDRVAMRRALRRAFNQTRNERIQLRQARRDLGILLAADPYDKDAVSAGFARLRAADGAVKTGLHEGLVIQLEKLSAEQRQAMLRQIEQGARRLHQRDERRQPPRRDRPGPSRD